MNDQRFMKHTTTGRMDVLNCGEGHLEITFKDGDVVEMERAKRIIGDMLRRGYALFVHGTDQALIRVQEFSEKHNAYIIADGPTVPPEALPATATPDVKPRRGKGRRCVPMATAHATVVGRSAGG